MTPAETRPSRSVAEFNLRLLQSPDSQVPAASARATRISNGVPRDRSRLRDLVTLPHGRASAGGRLPDSEFVVLKETL